MRFRKLRIAWSVVSGVACVLLIVMWVRSHWHLDGVAYRHPPRLGVWLVSSNGQLRCEIERKPDNVAAFDGDADAYFVFNRPIELDPERGNGNGFLGFRLLGGSLMAIPVIPHWFAVIVFGAMAVVLGYGSLPWRFSLRTLLIATTLVAVLLGVAVYTATH